ncbi:hypothetical protein ACQ4PT_054586 [Festuca glaucescens]
MDRLVLHSLKVTLAELLDANPTTTYTCPMVFHCMNWRFHFRKVGKLQTGRAMTCAASVQMAGSFSFVTPVQELFTENVLACLLYREELGVAGIARLGNREKVHLRTTTMQELLGRLMELIPSNKYLHARYVSLQHLRLHLVDVHCASKCPFTIGLVCSLALHEFGKKKFSARTVLLCDQCGREYHVGCLKEHGMADLTALPEGAWYCSMDCVKIWEALKDLVSRGAEAVPAADADLIKKKREEKGLNEEGDLDVRWRVLRDKSSEDSKLVLSKAVAIFHESFDPIIQATTGRDLIPAMVYGRSVRDQDYTGMYCAVLTVGKTVVSAGLFRVIGIEAAELPLVATSRDNQGLGYFQALFSCIERLLASLGVKHFVLPAADEAVSIWTQRFGFAKITQDELLERLKGGRTTVFHGTSTLHKLVLGTVPEDS